MKEGEKATPELLAQSWRNVLVHFNYLINVNHELRPIKYLIKYIIEKEYNVKLFSGTSLFTLLISLPQNNKISFNKTLRIACNHQLNVVEFEYIEKTINKISKWKHTCQYTEIVNEFEYFISQFDDWNKNK